MRRRGGVINAVAKPRSSGGVTKSNAASGSRKSPGARSRFVQPTMMGYHAYVRITACRETGALPVRFPSTDDELRLLQQLAGDDTSLFAATARFDERFVGAVHSKFGLNTRVSFATIRRQFEAQRGASGKRWREYYRQDCRLGIFDTTVPLIVRVVVGALGSGGGGGGARTTVLGGGVKGTVAVATPFDRFAHDTGVKPVVLNVAPLLFGRKQLTVDSESDSLSPAILRKIGFASMYYQRVYILHLLLWMTVCEGMLQGDDNEETTTTCRRQIVVIVPAKLQPLIEAPSSISVLLHTDPRVSLIYQ